MLTINSLALRRSRRTRIAPLSDASTGEYAPHVLVIHKLMHTGSEEVGHRVRDCRF